MSVAPRETQRVSTPPLPSSIWLVAWTSLAGQVLVLAQRGVRTDDASLALSVVLGPLVVGYVAAGVVRARTVRLAVAWIVLVLSAIAELVGLVSADEPGDAALMALFLATSAAALVGLGRFHGTEWFAWQRTRPSSDEGSPIGRLVAIAMLVGVLGGIVEPADDGVEVRMNVAER